MFPLWPGGVRITEGFCQGEDFASYTLKRMGWLSMTCPKYSDKHVTRPCVENKMCSRS